MQQHSQVARSRQNPSSSATSTPHTSAGSSAVAGSPILLPATSPSSAEAPNGGVDQVRLAGRSQDALVLGVSGGNPTISGDVVGDVSTTTSGIGGGAAPGTPMARRKPVPSLVPPPVLVTVVGVEGEQEWDANRKVSSSALPFPSPPSPAPSPNRAYLSPSDAEGGRRWSGSYSDDTLAVMEEQRRKRAVLHGRYHHDATEDDTTPSPDLEGKGGGHTVGDVKIRLKSGGGGIIPFPGKRDSVGYPPSATQRQLLQTTGASARRRREQVRESTYSCGTKKTNESSFKGCTSPSLLTQFRSPFRDPLPCLLYMADTDYCPEGLVKP